MATSQLGKVNRICWQLVAGALVLFALMVSLIRGLLPQLADVRHEIVDYLQQQYQLEVQVGELSAKWQAFGPALTVHQLVIPQQNAMPLTIVAENVQIKLDFWESLISLSPQIDTVVFDGLTLSLDIDHVSKLKTNSAASHDVDWLYALFLEQLKHFSITNAKLQLLSQHHQFRPIFIKDLQWLNSAGRHQGQGIVHVEENASDKEQLSIRVDLLGNGYRPNTIAGELYVAAKSLDLGEWASRQDDPQFDFKHIEFEGVINLEAWVAFSKRSVQDALLTFEPSWLKWGSKDKPHRLDIKSGQLTWQPNEQGWLLDSHQLNFVTNGEPWQPLSMAVKYQQGDMFASISPVSLKHFTPLLPLIPGIWQQEVETWHYVNPQGSVGPIKLYKPDGQPLRADVHLNHIRWNAYKAIPGIKGIDLDLNWANQRLSFNLPAQNYSLDFANNFRQNLAFKGAPLNGYFDTQSLELVAPHIGLSNQDIAIDANLALALAHDANMSLAANLAIKDVSQAQKYFPRQSMSENLVNYLKSGLVAGDIPNAKVLWNGQFNQFPFDDNSGVFQAQFTLNDATFSFQPNWPAVTDLTLNALFNNAAMHLDVESGLLGKVPADGAQVAIERFQPHSVLTVKADLRSDAKDAIDVINRSPLRTSVGHTLDVVQIHDTIATQLDLTIPLFKGQAPLSKGTVSFDNNKVFISKPGLNLESVQGKVSFVNDRVQGQGISAQLFDQPLQFDFNTQKQNKNTALNINLNGSWDLQNLPANFTNPLTDFYHGTMDWNSDLLMVFDPDGYTLRAHASSNLVGTEFTLPGSFAKSAIEPRLIEAELVGDNVRTSLSVKLANQAEFWGEFAPDSGEKLAHYDLMLGRRFKLGDQLLKQDGHLQIDLPDAQLTQWLPVINGFTKGQALTLADAATDKVNQVDNTSSAQPADSSNTETAAPASLSEVASQPLTETTSETPSIQRGFFPPLKAIDADIGQLHVMGQTFEHLSLAAKPLTHVWRFDVDSDQFAGNIDFYPQWREQGLKIVAKKLYLSPEMRSESAAEFTAGEILDSVPTLAVNVDDFQFYGIKFGKLVLQGNPNDQGYRFQTISLNQPAVNLTANGQWQRNDGKDFTRFDVKMNATKFDDLSKMLGINLGIKDAPLNLVGSVSWPQVPYRFSLAELNGKVKFDIGKGHLSEVSDKGARILSLFSLDSILRKLSLDFSDVFGQGLYFNRFNGQLDIDNGVVKTTNTEMDAIAGNMKVRGYTDLTTRSLNYDIRFVPQLASSVPTVVLLSTSAWTLGIGAFALTKVLEPVIEVISEIRFRLTGSMDAPKLEELERKSKEIEIPKEVLRDTQHESQQGAPQESQQQPATPVSPASPQTNDIAPQKQDDNVDTVTSAAGIEHDLTNVLAANDDVATVSLSGHYQIRGDRLSGQPIAELCPPVTQGVPHAMEFTAVSKQLRHPSKLALYRDAA
ncbi:YhdP family protein [Shewanella intestini]|uniref:TIGR02099 family protein n=1 Tax=Shewanella intestini TaxID=2017544 RepID=A0ABS5I425_9GAMM|nr:YhdP family protein [Shewanella sp. XMDDZSB0408]MBR9728769.1 TIGR02099 family protein [Shewanella intestini]MRG36844.1 TIGR02099 family protein [Shewanella sp. XMDDZSB0408]